MEFLEALNLSEIKLIHKGTFSTVTIPLEQQGVTKAVYSSAPVTATGEVRLKL